MAKGNPNPKTENLVSIGDMPREKQLEVTSAGGKARQEQIRKRKAMREQLEILLSLPVVDEVAKSELERMGFQEDEMNNQLLMLVAMHRKVLSGEKGDVQAFIALRDTAGDKPTDKLEVGNANTDKLDSILRQLRED